MIIPKIVLAVALFEMFFSFPFVGFELAAIVVKLFLGVELLLNFVGILLI